VEGLTKKFGKFVALENVNVSFPEGQLTAIIGPNGAGKSTFFNLISGEISPSRGKIYYYDRDITDVPQYKFSKLGIAKSFQITNIFPELSTLENVRIAIQAMHSKYQLWKNRNELSSLRDEAYDLLGVVGLQDRAKRRADTLAHGEQRSLEIAIALACNPRLLLLDEPTAGMSPEETVDLMDLATKLAVDRTILIVEHKMKLIMGISHHLVVFHQGKLLAEGSPDEVRNNDDVKRVYLGSR